MDSLLPAAGALALFLAFAAARRREAGLSPHFVAEVYFVAAPGFAEGAPPLPPWEPAGFRRLQAYRLAGGAPAPPGLAGAWLFGPRPARGSPGVLPFGGAGSPVWFQPPPPTSSWP